MAVRNSPFPDSPAARVLAFEEGAFAGRAAYNGVPLFAATARHEVEEALSKALPERRGVGADAANRHRAQVQALMEEDLHERARAAAALAVIKRLLTWSASCGGQRTSAGARDVGDQNERHEAALAPRAHPPTAHMQDLLLLRTGDNSAAKLGMRAFSTPMSALGAGAAASRIIGGSRAKPRALCVIQLMAGSAALHSYPWRPRGATTGHAGGEDDRSSGLYGPPSTCHLCQEATCTPQHIFCWCAHPQIAATRDAVAATATVLVKRLGCMAVAAMRAQYPDTERRAHTLHVPPVEQAAARARALVSNRGWTWRSRDGAAALYRLILTVPWPASMARPARGAGPGSPPPPLTAALGALFDGVTVKPHLQRRINTTWTDWAVDAVSAMARTWRAVNIAALRGPVGAAHAALSWRYDGPEGGPVVVDDAAVGLPDAHPAQLPDDGGNPTNLVHTGGPPYD